ncbi:MAG: Diadenylate cyclase spyDAC; Bacterial checkpoint controller DisA with nucleotide-binding domain [uncultured Thermomicrobiales bacterium]|uniref:Diadenylate cyclase n=1 Tax=uncultured Thermomicrobiales bacterium TaxID=1645740 RepID=A0A6J4VT92_9BACT|nr:MAG: Diadenylate cyclase spyDAC; Bacterial checkpoint controller DisA with nucleotide-binding domain [uncultured Thermomicrobiales bacterium]
MPDLFWLATRLNLAAALDIVVVAAIFFWLLTIAQGTRAVPLIRGAIILIVLLVLISTILPLNALRYVLRSALPALLLAIPIIFQPELRRALEQLGHTGNWVSLPFVNTEHPHPGAAAIEEMVTACVSLGRQRIGALIAVERETGLQEYADKGVRLDATLTRQLLINIFFKNSPLHDGAVIVRADRIVAARCIMPLSEGELPGSFGTRHRAALGISEESDAVAVIVSEQTGGISLAHDGQIDRDLTGDQLRASLLSLLEPPPPDEHQRRRGLLPRTRG